MDRELNGTALKSDKCITCSNGTQPSDDKTRCVPCHWSMINCNCPSGTHDLLSKNVCVPRSIVSAWPSGPENYEMLYNKEIIQSQLLYNSLFKAIFLCKVLPFQYSGFK